MTQKLKQDEIPVKGWSAIDHKGEIVMWLNIADGAIIMFTKQNECLFVPEVEIIEYASTQVGKAKVREIAGPTPPPGIQ